MWYKFFVVNNKRLWMQTLTKYGLMPTSYACNNKTNVPYFSLAFLCYHKCHSQHLLDLHLIHKCIKVHIGTADQQFSIKVIKTTVCVWQYIAKSYRFMASFNPWKSGKIKPTEIPRPRNLFWSQTEWLS